jgi:hypothetical protein
MKKLPFDIVDEGAPSQLFVDGFIGMLHSPANSKITFYQTVEIDQETKREIRKRVVTLVIPNSSMVDLCRKFLKRSQALENPTPPGVDKAPEQ